MNGLGVRVGRLGFVGEAAALERGEGIVVKQRIRDLLAAALGDGVERGAKLQRAAFHVVRVAGDEVDAILIQPLLGAVAARRFRNAREGIAR